MSCLIIVLYPLAHTLSLVAKPGSCQKCVFGVRDLGKWECGLKKYSCTSTLSNIVKDIVNDVMGITAALAHIVM